jgi:hypothetical protein
MIPSACRTRLIVANCSPDSLNHQYKPIKLVLGFFRLHQECRLTKPSLEVSLPRPPTDQKTKLLHCRTLFVEIWCSELLCHTPTTTEDKSPCLPAQKCIVNSGNVSDSDGSAEDCTGTTGNAPVGLRPRINRAPILTNFLFAECSEPIPKQ